MGIQENETEKFLSLLDGALVCPSYQVSSLESAGSDLEVKLKVEASEPDIWAFSKHFISVFFTPKLTEKQEKEITAEMDQKSLANCALFNGKHFYTMTKKGERLLALVTNPAYHESNVFFEDLKARQICCLINLL